MSKKQKQAEAVNNCHECKEEKSLLQQQDVSLLNSFLSPDEINMIWDFYVSHAPIKKDKNEKIPDFTCRWLGDYGWHGSPDLALLEKELIKKADIGHFVMIKADKIDETLKSMNLEGEICWVHPRAVLSQNFTVAVRESGEVAITNSENRMVCLFRHIRNALAHNRIYYSNDNTMILLEDADSLRQAVITARILIPVRCLIDWIAVIDKEKKYYGKEQKDNAMIEEDTQQCSA